MRQLVLLVALIALTVAAHAQTGRTIRFYIQDGTETVSISQGYCTINIGPRDGYIYGKSELYGRQYGASILLKGDQKSWTAHRLAADGHLEFEDSEESIAYSVVGKACRDTWHNLPSGLRSRLNWYLGSESNFSERHHVMNAVTVYNAYTLWFFVSPSDDMKKDRLFATTVKGGGAENDIRSMIPRFRGSDKLTDESTHQIDAFESVDITGSTATVRTIESAYWKSSARVRYNADRVPHTYTLQKIGGEWKVSSDTF